MGYKLQLGSVDILNRQFRPNVKGYDPLEVDQFLDKVLEEFRRYEQFALEELPALEKAGAQLEQAKNRIHALEVEVAVLSEKLSGLNARDTTTVNRTNLDLHQRISALEKALYKLGQDPTKIR